MVPPVPHNPQIRWVQIAWIDWHRRRVTIGNCQQVLLPASGDCEMARYASMICHLSVIIYTIKNPHL